MKHKLGPLFLLLIVCLVATAQQPFLKTTKPKQVTGQYRLRKNEFRSWLDVRQLSDGKIKFALVALWISPNNPQNIHNGEIHGVVPLENGMAVYQSGTCKITMKFTLNRATITESGDNADCGFGANVTAAGAYRKINSKIPKFDF